MQIDIPKYQALLARETSKNTQSERSSILDEFRNEINKNRAGTIYKPISPARISMMFPKEIPTSDLYYTQSICRDYGNRYKTKTGHKNYSEGYCKKLYYEIRTK